MARRLQGGKIAPKAEHLERVVNAIDEGVFAEPVEKLMAMDVENLKKAYTEREMEPHMSEDDWRPADNYALLG